MIFYPEFTFKELLSDAEIFIDGDWIESKDQDQNGNIRLIQLADIGDGVYIDKSARFLTAETAKRLKCTFLKEGDILIARMPEPLGRACIFPKSNTPCITVVDICIIRANANKIYNRWLMHAINSPIVRQQINEYITGTTRKRISRGNLSKIKIQLPPFEEQRRIAAILDQADELRQKRQESINKLDELLQATFIEMFGDPVTNPKNLKTKSLKELSIKIQSGNTPKGGKQNYIKKGIIFLRSQNIWKNKIILEDVVFIDEKTHLSMSGSSINHGDILLTKTGRINTENSSLGRAAIYLGKDNSANINGHVYLIRLKKEINKLFVLCILTMPSYYEYIRSVCVGGIDKRQLNKDHIENFPILIPPLGKQEKMSKIIMQVTEQKQKLQAQLEQQNNLFNSLQQQAFSGKL